MVKIRLRRMGARNSPFYRIVVSDSRRTARAEVLEEIGSYDPVAGIGKVKVDRQRAEFWIGRGALLSPTVRAILGQPAPVQA
jgi:small subunit ribosomal protein S16